MIKSYTEQFYYLMKLGREFELKAKEEYMKGNIGGFLHLAIGEEAVHVGAVIGFGKGDVFTPYREHILAIAKGMDIKLIMAELFGKFTGVSKGKGGSMHLFENKINFYGGNAIVGAHIPHAVGCAYARKYQNGDPVMVIFGDGATNAGNFYESLNLAALWEVPLLFLCENNYYAIGTRIDRASFIKDIYKKAEDYMPSIQIDGMDVFEVFEAVKKAKEYIETYKKPYFIEALTYRYEPHSMSDTGNYRSPRELEIAKSKDPINKLKQKALSEGIMKEEDFEKLDEIIQKEIEEAVKFALESPEPPEEELYTDIFCEVCQNVIP